MIVSLELLWLAAAFLSGSVPYSLLLGRLVLRTDIRRYGDGNPGATNLLRAGGGWWGGLGILLDGFKAAIPVGWVYWSRTHELAWMVAIAAAPVFGHAFSPFLRGRGGKAVAAIFGVWTGLTLFEAPLILGLWMVFFYALLMNSGWAVTFSQLGLGAFLVMYHPSPLNLWVWLVLFCLTVWKQRAELGEKITLRPAVMKFVARLIGRYAGRR